MEPRTAAEIVGHMQPLLRKYEGDDGLVLMDAHDEPGAQLGDNYMSVVFRTKIIGKHKDGKPYDKTFITKCFPHHRMTVEMMRAKELFLNEIQGYDNILPALGNFGPRCVQATTDKIILEDLKGSGFVLCNKRLFLDFEHALFTVQTLAKFHAKSLAIKFADPEKFERLTSNLYEVFSKSSPFETWGKTIIPSAIRHIKATKPQTEEIEKLLKHLESISDDCFHSMLESFTAKPKKKFYVICHGDSWTNNLLFKHDSKGNVIDMKLIDFQIMRHASPACDFHYHVYTSARDSVLFEKYEDLVLGYFNQLKKQLRESNVPDKEHEDLTLDWFKNELKENRIFGVGFGTALAIPHLAEGSNIINMDELTEEDMGNKEKWENFPIQANVAERMRAIALHYYRTYVV